MLQQFLNTHGYLVATSGLGSIGHETSVFGAKTERALAAYLRDHASHAPIASSLSLPLFVAPLHQGEQSIIVKQIQYILARVTTLISKDDANGVFGPITFKAVRDFQCIKNIVCSGTEKTTGWGVIGKKTYKALQAAG